MTQATNHKVGLGSGGGGRSPLYIYIYMERERKREICIYMRERTINVGSLCRLSSVPWLYNNDIICVGRCYTFWPVYGLAWIFCIIIICQLMWVCNWCVCACVSISAGPSLATRLRSGLHVQRYVRLLSNFRSLRQTTQTLNHSRIMNTRAKRGPPQARTRATTSQNAGHRKPEHGPPQVS